MKKIICLIMIVVLGMTSVVLPVSTVSAQDIVSMQIFDKLDKLGIINGYKYDEVLLYEPVTRYEFLAALTNITTDNEVSLTQYNDEIVDSAVGLGVIADKSAFRPDDTVLLEEAVKMSVVMLGYANDAQRLGGYPFGHMSVATTLKLTTGVNADAGEMFNLYDMLRLIDNVMDAPVLVQTTYGVREEYTARTKDTLLYLKRDIYVTEGIVTSNEYTSLYGITGVGKGRISIGNAAYMNDDISYNNLLGCAVEAYVKEDDVKSDVVLYMGESSDNETVKITDKLEPSISSDFTELSYYPEDSIRKTTLDIAAAPSVIKNGVLFDAYTVSDFEFASGDLLLIDNNRDGVYDVVKITSYQLMVLSSAPGNGDTLINMYSHQGVLRTLNVGDYDSSKFINIEMDGKSISSKDLQKYDVVNVAVSEDGRVVNVYVTRKTATGTITGTDDSSYKVYINDTEYEMSEGYKAALSHNDSNASKLKIGNKFVLYLDIFGEIAAAVSTSGSEYSYGYLTNGAFENGLDGALKLKMYTDADEWATLEVARKLKVNDDSNTDAELLTKISTGGTVKPQLLAYKLNESGIINEVLVAEVGASGRSDKYMCLEPVTGTYRQNNSSVDWGCFVRDDAVIWVVPTDLTQEDAFYLDVKANIFVNGTTYTVTPYNVDEYNATDKLVYQSDNMEQDAASSNVFLIEKVGSGVDEDGNSVQQLTGVVAGYPQFTIQAGEDGLFDGLKKGDAIGFTANGGKVRAIKKHYSLDNGKQAFLVNGWHSMSSVAGGTVTDLDLDYPRMKLASTSDKNVMLNPATIAAATKVLIYYADRDMAQVGSLSDITIGDYVVLRLVYSRVADLIIYR